MVTTNGTGYTGGGGVEWCQRMNSHNRVDLQNVTEHECIQENCMFVLTFKYFG